MELANPTHPDPSIASGPEVDFGCRWTTSAEPTRHWRIAWDSGTGALTGRPLGHDSPVGIRLYGHYRTASGAQGALPANWPALCLTPGGLDIVDRHHTTPAATLPAGVTGPGRPALEPMEPVSR